MRYAASTMSQRTQQFQQVVWGHYRAHGRHDLPWRQFDADGSLDAYKVLVSEMMLQQTQVPRVVPKFEDFLQRFPSFETLAAAPLADVLKAWSGLGYNRRAKFLWQAAVQVVREHGGRLPQTSAMLVRLPGIGPNTAGAVLAYAFNKPAVFIETNIRTVFIHHFFNGQKQVSDKEIADLVAQSLPDNPRQWYWALMDYGTHLKQTVGNLNMSSKHYAKQSAFQGSRRQIRGQVLRLLHDGSLDAAALRKAITDPRLAGVLADLVSEEMLQENGGYYALAGA
jgi:A/G-specific adenine glycosylase